MKAHRAYEFHLHISLVSLGEEDGKTLPALCFTIEQKEKEVITGTEY